MKCSSKFIINGDKKDRDDYLNFLKAGYSKFPLDTLKNAGVDMSTPEPIEAAIDYFDELLGTLRSLEVDL